MEPVALAWAVLIISVTGFLYLSTWIRGIEKNVATNADILLELKKINLALVGDLERPGVITKMHDHDKEIKMIKDVCKEKHERLEHVRV
jgi:hypothetical protein